MIDCLCFVDVCRFLVNDVNVWRFIVDGNFLYDIFRSLRNEGKFYSFFYLVGFISCEGLYFFFSFVSNVIFENF